MDWRPVCRHRGETQEQFVARMGLDRRQNVMIVTPIFSVEV